MTELVLGPMLRYVDDRRATIWVETDGPATVQLLNRSARTFRVADHHYALVQVDGLQPGSVTPYELSLNGTQVWPPAGSTFPGSVIRTTHPERPFRVAFGSCRTTRPNVEPYTLDRLHHRKGVGVDALQALANRLRYNGHGSWPELLLFTGDQVYADAVSPETERFIRARRDTRRPPGRQVADFEEYSQLYREAWSDPTVRWLLSTIPTAMIFDDHDIHDDWNTSAAWRRQMAAASWWPERITGGLLAYWLYQHLGNMSPEALASDELFRQAQSVPDAGPLLSEFAARADTEAAGGKPARWSYRRDYGNVRLVVLDTRCGRIVENGHRQMLAAPEVDWLVAQTGGEIDHLLIASSLPVLLPPAVFDLEGWNEAVCAGAWGKAVMRLGEIVRQAIDLEHWAAFRHSFDDLIRIVADIRVRAAERRPAMILFLSGDVHYSYLAQANFPAPEGLGCPVYQAVCSPLRNPTQRSVQIVNRFTRTGAGRWLARWLARSAGVSAPALTWETTHGPWSHNGIATVTLDGKGASLSFDQAPSHPSTGEPALDTVCSVRLSPTLQVENR